MSFMKCKNFVTHAKKIFSTDKNDKNVFKLYQKVRDHSHFILKLRGASSVKWSALAQA